MQIFSCCPGCTQPRQSKNVSSNCNKYEVFKKITGFLYNDITGVVLLLAGLALVPFTGGTSLITLLPAMAAFIPVSVGIGVGSSLLTAAAFVLFNATLRYILRQPKEPPLSQSRSSSVEITNA